MTGYGRSEEISERFILNIEIRSVNSRFLDFSPRLPRVLIPFEDHAYKLIKKRIERGRVSLSCKLEYLQGHSNKMSLNKEKLVEYIGVFKEIQKKINIEDLPNIGDIIRFPDILVTDEQNSDDDLKTRFIAALNKAIDEVEKSRIEEGSNIKEDLSKRINLLISFIDKIRNKILDDKDKVLDKYKKKIQSLVNTLNLDEARLYQEIGILAEKKDITEEIVRLDSHIDLFKKYMNSKENKGKKLNFLIQEMGREINTIGSKTDDLGVSHLSVDMKDELEKIREQVQNIV
jgi:uncharacterized protein (TIGR00255 family)